MQDQVNEKAVSLSWRGAKFTAQQLAKLCKQFLAAAKSHATKGADGQAKPQQGGGKKTVKELIGNGDEAKSVPITDGNIKSFEKIARKYGIDFALVKDDTEIGRLPKWTVFFKARDADILTSAIKEFTAKTLAKKADKPSLIGKIKDSIEQIKVQTVDKTRHNKREQDGR
jgi:hypothetical protein